MKHWKKYLSVLAVVSCIGLVTAGLGGQDEKASAQGEADEGSDDIGALGGEMAALWGEKACVAEQTTKYEEPVISIACDAEYTSGERDKMLDLLFKKGYKFRGESYDIKGTTGHYWYKFEKRDGSRARIIFVRLHITSQGPLWGAVKPPARIAVYVDNLANNEELTAWQTLGVPLTFGLKPADGAKELAQQVEEYKQEAWLALDLRQGSFSEPDQSASVRDIIEQDLIAPYIKSALEQTGDVWGFVIRDLNNITTTVASARAVFAAIKAEGKSYVLLPAKYNRALTTTANLMDINHRRVTYDMAAMCNKSPRTIWTFLRGKSASGAIIARFPASYKRCANALSRTLRRDGRLEFKTLSNFYGYKAPAE
ncbi:MAG: hypothetical protein U1F16_08950 [Turneriella sp.]